MKYIKLVGVIGLFWSGVAIGLQAQAPFPGAVKVNGGWVPCNHKLAIDAGLGCTSQAPITTACNPYTCPDQFLPQPPRDVFEPGQLIRQPYPNFEAVVISVALDDTKTIVTARITKSNGVPRINDYIAFDAAHTQWCAGECR
jgi:hypothetical protein